MLRLTACAVALLAICATARAAEPPHSAELDDMIVRQAKRHGVPEKLVRRIVMRESKYNAHARNRSYWGLMQISYPTAKSMGFKGSPSELLDPLVNLTYAVPYLANAFIIAGKQEDAAVRLYASGYYTTAKNRNLLGELRTADSRPMTSDEGFVAASARPVANLFSTVVSTPAAIAAAQAPLSQQTSQPQPGQVAGSGPDGAEPEVAMTPGKTGLQPPKKWLRDGGTTVIAKGEQRIEQIAAYVPPPGSEPETKSAHRSVASRGKGHKTTEFASLDAPPPEVQAYAPAGPDPRAAEAPQSGPQAAITQATASDAQLAPAQPNAVLPEPPVDETPAKVSRHGSHARKAIATKKDADGGAQVATNGADRKAADDDKSAKSTAKIKHASFKKHDAQSVADATKTNDR